MPRRLPRISPARYRSLTFVALILLCIIVATGALVRLTGSGLGCDDWPNCNGKKLIDVSTGHAAIEQLNRLFTGLVGVGVIAAVLGSLLRAPRRRDLVWLSWGLVAGVVAQAVLGGIVVRVRLHPTAVQGHFLLSMVLCANALILHRRAAWPDTRVAPARDRRLGAAVLGVVVLTAAALTTGTVVTGAGPHSGQVKCSAGAEQPASVEDAVQQRCELPRRYGFTVRSVARVHSVTVILTILLVLALLWVLRRQVAERERLVLGVQRWVFIAGFQGLIGYVQYFNGIPWVLVAVHVTLATLLWLAAVDLAVAAPE